MVTLVNRAKVSTSTTGTGTLTLGAAADGYQTFGAAGVTDGDVVRYVIEDGSNWEIGTGTYTASGTTLSRTVSESSNADAAINLSGTATVFVGATAADLVQTGPSLQAIASGSLSDGSTVVINADGTVSVVAGQVLIEGAGTPVVFEAAGTSEPASVFDSVNNKVVIAYRDTSNSGFGTAVVGTVSGTSISFGTPVVFENASIFATAITFDTAAGKVVIAYLDQGNSNYGTAVVGTVSGTSISFGTPVVFSSLVTQSMSSAYDSALGKVVIIYEAFSVGGVVRGIVGTVSGSSISFGSPADSDDTTNNPTSAVYDVSSQKVVVAFRNMSSVGKAAVGTVSGTSFSFGSSVVVTSSIAGQAIGYDANADKVVVVYADNDNSGYGTARVGTVSGTSVSFGSPVVYSSTGSYVNGIGYDANAQKMVVAFRKGSSPNTAIAATVSGTSISFGSDVVLQSLVSNNNSVVYDPNNKKMVITYINNDTADGISVVFQNAGVETNLTAENFIGFSDAAYADTATATIQLVGSVDDAQSGLSAGQRYYVQTDGGLGTSDTGVYAGIAVASNKIIVKG